jgi:hypothetical protein
VLPDFIQCPAAIVSIVAGFFLRFDESRSITAEQLQTVCKARPFKPFVLHLADGREIPVQHPDFVMSVPSGRTMFVDHPDDTTNIIDLLLATDIGIKAGGNGAGKGYKLPLVLPQPDPGLTAQPVLFR